MTVLDEIIDGASDDSVSTSNLLRKVQVVAHRLKAVEISEWVKKELNGYKDLKSLPAYRGPLPAPVMGTWMGYNTKATLPLGEEGVIDEAVDLLFRNFITQSVSEIEQLVKAPGASDPQSAWSPTHVGFYNRWFEEGKVTGLSGSNLIHATKTVTRGTLEGVLGSVRGSALEFALELQDAAPTAGSQDGPTVTDPPIAATVYNTTNNIYGNGANVAQGSTINQQSTVTVGDLGGLLDAVRNAGFTDPEGLRELSTIVLAGAPGRPSKIQRFIERVKDGAFDVAKDASVKVLAGEISDFVTQFLG